MHPDEIDPSPERLHPIADTAARTYRWRPLRQRRNLVETIDSVAHLADAIEDERRALTIQLRAAADALVEARDLVGSLTGAVSVQRAAPRIESLVRSIDATRAHLRPSNAYDRRFAECHDRVVREWMEADQ